MGCASFTALGLAGVFLYFARLNLGRFVAQQKMLDIVEQSPHAVFQETVKGGENH